MRPLLVTLASLALFMGALAGVWWFGAPEVHRWVARSALEFVLERDVEIDGSLEVGLGAESQLQVTGLRIDNPPWAEMSTQLQIERGRIHIALRPLLRGAIVFPLVELEGVTIALETAADGRHSWQPDGGPTKEGGWPLVGRASVRDATVTYRDHRDGRRIRLHLASLTHQPDHDSGDMRLDATGDINGQAFQVTGTTGDLETALAGTDPYPLELEIRLPSTEATLAGTIADVARRRGLDLRLEARNSSLRAAVEAWNASVPGDAEATVAARLTGDLAALSLADVDAEISSSSGDRLEIAGSIGNVWKGMGLDGRVGLKLDPAGTFGQLLPPDWRFLNQIEATASVAGSAAALAFKDLSADIRGPGGSRLTLAGNLQVATSGGVLIERFDLNSTLEVMRTNDLTKLLDLGFPGLERLWFEGKLSGDERRLDADGRASLGETRIDGVLSGDFGGARPRFKGHLHSPRVRLGDLGLVPSDSRDPAPADQGIGSAESHLFGREPFRLDGLQKLDLDLEVQVDSLEGIALAIDRASAHVVLTEGKLQLSGARFEAVDGYAEVDAEVNVREPTPTWRLRARTDDVDLGDAWRQLETDVPIRGELDLVLDLTAAGKSPRDLASSLSGDLSLALQRGQIRSRLFDLTAMNPIRWLAARSTRRGYAAIDCFVARVQADRGIAEVLALVLDTPNVIATGQGYIDFASETLDLRIRPRAKQRRLLQLATPFALRGSLADPVVAYSPTGATARTLGRVVASPVNLLGTLLPFVGDRGRDRDNPCLTLSDPDAGAP